MAFCPHSGFLCRAPLIGAAVVLVLAVASVAAAQDVSEEEMADFEQHVATASEHVDAGEYREGIEQFEAAIEIIDHPRLSTAIADAYAQWGRCGSAEERYQQLLERDDVEGSRRQNAEDALDEVVDQCIERAPLEVRCSPEETDLSADDDELDEQLSCGVAGDVPAGEYQVTADAEGFESQVSTLVVEGETDNEFRVELSPPEPDEVESPPDEDPYSWLSMAGWGAIGVGAALGVAGGVSDYGAAARTDQAAEARADHDFERLEQIEADADSARTRTIALYGAGGLLVATGVAAQFIDVAALVDDGDQANPYSLEIGPTGVSATVNW